MSKSKDIFLQTSIFILLLYTANANLSGINLALFSIAKSLHIEMQKASLILVTYNLFFGVFIIVGGKAGDYYGRKIVFIIGTLIFSCSSLISMSTKNINILIISCGLQGFASALFWPNAVAMSYALFSNEKKHIPMTITPIVAGLASAVTPVLTGQLIPTHGWKCIFLINFIISGFAIFPSFLFIRNDNCKSRDCSRIDVYGCVIVVLLSVTINTSIYLVGKLNQLNFFILSTNILFAALLTIFLLNHCKKSKNPVINLYVFKHPIFLASTITRFLTTICYSSVIYVMSYILQIVLSYTPLRTGAILSPMMIAACVGSLLAGIIINKGYIKLILLIGLSLMLAGILSLFIFNNFSFSYQAALDLIIFGSGLSIATPALGTLALKSLPEPIISTGSGIYFMASLLGASVGVNISSAIMNLTTNEYLIKLASSKASTKDIITISNFLHDTTNHSLSMINKDFSTKLFSSIYKSMNFSLYFCICALMIGIILTMKSIPNREKK